MGPCATAILHSEAPFLQGSWGILLKEKFEMVNLEKL